MDDNTTTLDLSDYPDIDLSEFSMWFEKKFFKIVINNDINWYKDKYDVDIWFHIDRDNRKFSMELKLVDVTDISEEDSIRFEKMLLEAKNKNNNINGCCDEEYIGEPCDFDCIHYNTDYDTVVKADGETYEVETSTCDLGEPYIDEESQHRYWKKYEERGGIL